MPLSPWDTATRHESRPSLRGSPSLMSMGHKGILILFLTFGVFACAKKVDDPLIVPPNFSEMPDPNNPEKPPVGQTEEDVARLKELLLQSDE